MVLDFNFQIKQLNGNNFDGDSGNAGKLLGDTLSQMNQGNAIKLWDWAIKLYNGKKLEIDEADSKILSGLIETTNLLPNITKAQLCEYINSKMGE